VQPTARLECKLYTVSPIPTTIARRCTCVRGVRGTRGAPVSILRFVTRRTGSSVSILAAVAGGKLAHPDNEFTRRASRSLQTAAARQLAAHAHSCGRVRMLVVPHVWLCARSPRTDGEKMDGLEVSECVSKQRARTLKQHHAPHGRAMACPTTPPPSASLKEVQIHPRKYKYTHPHARARARAHNIADTCTCTCTCPCPRPCPCADSPTPRTRSPLRARLQLGCAEGSRKQRGGRGGAEVQTELSSSRASASASASSSDLASRSRVLCSHSSAARLSLSARWHLASISRLLT